MGSAAMKTWIVIGLQRYELSVNYANFSAWRQAESGDESGEWRSAAPEGGEEEYKEGEQLEASYEHQYYKQPLDEVGEQCV